MSAVLSSLLLCSLFLFSVPAPVLSYNNGVGEFPIRGWNSWCTDDACGALDYCTEFLAKSIADAIVEQGLDKLGYQYVNLDDCWSATTRDKNGNLQPNPLLFPSGMKALADYVHSKGLKLGLYTCSGTLTCKHGRPGSYGHYDADARQMAAWGVDLVKADNCHTPSGTTSYERMMNFSRALNATGRPMIFSLCQWGEDNVDQWGAEAGQMFRFQQDHLPFWHFPPKAAGTGFGQGVKDIIEFMATLKPSTIVKKFGIMDPDMLMTLFWPTMSFEDSRTEFTFWTLWSAPLLVSTDLRNLTTEKLSIIANPLVLEIHHDPLVTSGERIVNGTDGGQLWARPLASGAVAVVLYNSADAHGVSVSFTFNQVGLPVGAGINYQITDLWQQQRLIGKFSSSATYGAKIAPHDVQFIKIERV